VEEGMLLRAKQLPEQDHIIVNVEYKKTKIFLHEISYIEGLKDYVKIYLVDRESPLLTRSNLRGMEKILPTIDFLRIHNSFIVNKNRIEQVAQNKLTLPETALPIGKKYIKNIEQFI
jgi:DNA-binding LytR/AlgR family response regulator